MAADLVPTLLQFQPGAVQLKSRREYDHEARSFAVQLANLPAALWPQDVEAEQRVLGILNPSVNTMAYAYVLRHRIASLLEKRSVPESLKPGGALWGSLVLFFETADAVQLRYVGAEWRRLVEFTEQIARAAGSPGLAIAPIRSAMVRLDATTGTFTSTHLAFLRLCMETRSYAAAEPILDNYIHTLPARIPSCVREGLEYSVACADVVSSGEYMHQASGHSEKVGLQDVQEYYVLGAMAYVGLRKFKKAQHFLEFVLMVPAGNVANGLMLEAYKKWVLLRCLVGDATSALPRTANSTAMRQVKSASKAYEALAEAYEQVGNLAKLKAQIKAGEEMWAEDGNQGLVQALLGSQMRAYVSQLSRTYSAIPVSKIAAHLGAEAEEIGPYLAGLIQDGQLNARLEGTEVLRFFVDATQGPLARTEKQQQRALLAQTVQTQALAEQVQEADYRLWLTREVLEHAKRTNKRTGQGGDGMDTAWEEGVDVDEDLMTDL